MSLQVSRALPSAYCLLTLVPVIILTSGGTRLLALRYGLPSDLLCFQGSKLVGKVARKE